MGANDMAASLLKPKFIFVGLFTIALAAIFAFSIYAQGGKERAALAEAERISKDTFHFSAKTKNGARVYSAEKASPEMLAAIDKGFKGLFAIAKKNGYKKRLKYSQYMVFIANPDRLKNADGNYSPDIAVAANQYAGSIFDKGGYIYAAGMVVANDPCAFLIGKHERDFGRVSDVVRYEGEHLILYHNDRKRYDETKDHSKGGGHPILQ